MSLNKVMLIGNVGQDPTVKYFDNKMCVASLRLATTEKGYTMQNGTQVPDRTEWHNLIFWGKLAETVESYVHKGDKLYVEGKIQTRNYDDRQGISRQVVEIMVNSMEMLTPRAQGTGAAPSPSQPSTPANGFGGPTPVTPSNGGVVSENEDVPF